MLPSRLQTLFIISLFFCCLSLGCNQGPPPPAVTLELRVADSVPVPGWEEKTIFGTGETIYVSPVPALTGKDFKRVKASEERLGIDLPVDEGQLSISIECNKEGARKLLGVTSTNLRKQLAIVVDQRVILAPKINSAISEKAELQGSFTREQRAEIIDLFNRAIISE